MALYTSSAITPTRLLVWLLVGLTIIAMAIPSIMKFNVRGTNNVALMTIDGQEITRQQVMHRYDMLRQQITMLQHQFAQQGTPFDAQALYLQARTFALESLINEALLNIVANRMHWYISPDYSAQKLADPFFVMQELADVVPPSLIMQTGMLNTALLPNILRHRGMSMTDFETLVDTSIKRLMVRATFHAGVPVPAFLRNAAYQQRYGAKQFVLLTLDQDTFQARAEREPVTDEQLAQFFAHESARGTYTVPEQRDGIAYTVTPDAYNLTITPAQIEAYYHEHKREFVKEPAQVHVRYVILDPAADNAPLLTADEAAFEATARDRKLKVQTRTITRTDEPAWASAAFALEHDGAITRTPINTSNGLVGIQRISRSAPTYKPLDEVRASIKKHLRMTACEQALTADLEHLRNAPDVPAALASFAERKKLRTKQYRNVRSSTADSPLEKKLMTTKLNQMGLVKQDDALVLVMPTAITKSHVPPLAEIRATVRADWYTARARELMHQELKTMQKELAATPAAHVARAHNADRYTTACTPLNEDDPAIKRITATGIALDALVYLYRPGASVLHTNDNHGYLLYLDTREPVAVDQEQARALEKELSEQMENALLNGFIASLYKAAKITNNEQLLGSDE